jgi:hypothetical protein
LITASIISVKSEFNLDWGKDSKQKTMTLVNIQKSKLADITKIVAHRVR